MAIDSLDDAYDSLQTEVLTEMEPYSLRWKPSWFTWNGRGISVLLPSGTLYGQDLIDARSGIPVPRSGEVGIALACKTRQVVNNTSTISTGFYWATLSLSLLERDLSKAEYLDRLKKRNVEILSQTDNSVITQEKAKGLFLCDTNIIEKTIVSGDVVLQIRCYGKEDPNRPTPFYRVFENISFAMQG